MQETRLVQKRSRIVTTAIYPPIPVRDHDWSAIDDDTYDGEGSLIGFGATEQDAIDDLVRQMEDSK